MSFIARAKNWFGGSGKQWTMAAATTCYVPDDAGVVFLTGTATITTLNAAKSSVNRIVKFYQSDSGSTTFTNSPGTTTAGQMDLGALDPTNITLGSTDFLELMLRSDMTWVRCGNLVNN